MSNLSRVNFSNLAAEPRPEIEAVDRFHHTKALLENPIFLRFLHTIATKGKASTSVLTRDFRMDHRDKDRHFGRQEVLEELEANLNNLIDNANTPAKLRERPEGGEPH